MSIKPPSPSSRLLAARDTLRSILTVSRSLPTFPSRRAPPLVSDPTTLPSPSQLSPALAVLKVFDAVHALEPSLLSDPLDDLPSYLSLLHRLRDALSFLSSNVALSLSHLDSFLHPNHPLKRTISSESSLDGGLLDACLRRLEAEFKRIIEENSKPVFINDEKLESEPVPVAAVEKLNLILDAVKEDDFRIRRCVEAFVEVRGCVVRRSLMELGLDYLKILPGEVQRLEKYVSLWGKQLEFAVRHIFEAEFGFCVDVFEAFGPPEVWMGCFADVALKAGILEFMRFGRTVTECKKDPIKLLKLLDIFASLSRVRLDFNRLFGGKACGEIQRETRDLIKRVVDESCRIFSELLVQVELQKQSPPPHDGWVPKLVSFTTNYCNILLSEEYCSVLRQVLVIHRSWNREKLEERFLLDSIVGIIQALERNLEAWSSAYEDKALSSFFLMNNHWHFCKNLRGTKVGDLIGKSDLTEHEQLKDYYCAVYLRESWGKLPALLSREGLMMVSAGRATARDLVKKRLKAFNEAFDEMYLKQSNWVVYDKELRARTCQLVIQAIVPVYRSYMQNYGPLVEQEISVGKYLKYTVQSLENMLGSLFHHKLSRSSSFASRRSNGKVNSVTFSV